MSDSVLVDVEGVLSLDHGGPLMNAAVNPLGYVLVAALYDAYSIVLTSTTVPYEDVWMWLTMQGIAKVPADILGSEEGDLDRRITTCRRRYSTALYISPSPDAVRAAAMLGMPGLLFVQPAYQRPEFRPGHPTGVRAWADLSGQMELDSLARAAAAGAEGDGVIGDEFEH